ncbi:hypothetical protein [Acidipila rosea]|nr:hypothetical protein [Acidipila rosea]
MSEVTPLSEPVGVKAFTEQCADSRRGGGLNDPAAGARNSPAALYSAVRMHDELLWRDRSRSQAPCPVWAWAELLNAALTADAMMYADLI